MDNKIGPNGNRFKEINEEISEDENKEVEAEYEEEDLHDENLEEEIKKEEKLAKDQFRAKLVKMMGVIIIVIIIIVLIGFIISLTSKKNYTYVEVEDIMKEAAQSYFSDHKKKLPSTISQKVEIHDKVLAEEEYMKTLDKYLYTDLCSGKVVVQKSNQNSYSYTAYLDCGSDYTTTELYKKVLDKKNIVTEGYGLYSYNGGYVYRGSDINNYVKFEDNDKIWRILKINSNHEITLVQNEGSINSFPWDNRYNHSFDDNLGINTYQNSFISVIVDRLYNNRINDESDSDYLYYNEEPTIFTKKIRSKLLKFKSCVGKRSSSDTSKDGSPECSEIIESKVALLPVYDFLNASLDPNCKTTKVPDCQNYNYLTNEGNYWLANGMTEDTASVYFVNSQGYIEDSYANSEQGIRLVIRIGSDMMIEKGKGTKKSPYVIR